MSIQPLISFKAGTCLLPDNVAPGRAKPQQTPGYVYLFQGDDELVHFCWRARSASIENPEIDLIMFPGDGSFIPYTGPEAAAESDNVRSPTDGRIFVLKFSSSSQRYLFWLQSKSQHPKGDPSWFSPRDLAIGQVIDRLLTGEEIDVQAELAAAISQGPSGDDDETMEDVEGTDHSANRNRTGSTGGAGAGATGGDIREEGEESREGGADGGRAAAAGSSDTSAIVQNFLNSLKSGASSSASSSQDPFTTLLDLLPPPTTVPVIDKAPDAFIDNLCSHLPATLFLLEQDIEDVGDIDPDSETAQMALQGLDQEQKRDILKRVVTSPQMKQSLGSLTIALRDGGLPNVSQALNIDVANGGFVRGGGMPLGGGDAVKAFVEGVKKTVEKERKGEDDDDMDTS